MKFFSVQNLSAGYGKSKILQNVSFSVEKGCVLGILGANGSGKTTLIKSICGLLPHEGTCLLEGTALETLSSRQLAQIISYIPQRSGIAIDISVLDVVLMGFNPRLGLLEQPTKAMKEAAMEALCQVGMADAAGKNYMHLSEGQKQLCILARTMVSGSRLLLLDEPESALDFQHRYRMLQLLRSWIERTNGGAIVTLHDPMLALNCCGKLLVLKDGEILDILSPKQDPMEKMEQALSRVYGPVSLQHITNRSGKKVLTMLKEDLP